MANFGAEYIDLSQVQFTPELLRLIPAKTVHKYQILPIFKKADRIGIVIVDPSDINAIDILVHLSNRVVELFVTDKAQLRLSLNVFTQRAYDHS